MLHTRMTTLVGLVGGAGGHLFFVVFFSKKAFSSCH